MDIEVAALCGAGHGERSPDRENQRNGERPRQWDTRAGTIGLNIPKLRKGSYVPFGPSIDPPDRSMPSATSLTPRAPPHGPSCGRTRPA